MVTKGVALDGPKTAWDSAISAYPIASNGYNDYFDFATKNAKVILSKTFDDLDINKKGLQLIMKNMFSIL